jgi:hypothetical protein
MPESSTPEASQSFLTRHVYCPSPKARSIAMLYWPDPPCQYRPSGGAKSHAKPVPQTNPQSFIDLD